MSFYRISIGRLFDSRSPAAVKLLSPICNRVCGAVGPACERSMTWGADGVNNSPTCTAERARAETCRPAPPVWSRFSASHFTGSQRSCLSTGDVVTSTSSSDWRAVLPHSVPTATVESDRQRCHTVVRCSSTNDVHLVNRRNSLSPSFSSPAFQATKIIVHAALAHKTHNVAFEE